MPPAFWILWTGALINRMGGFVMPLIALYLTGERGRTVEEAGFIVALLGAGSLASGPAGGFLADHIGRRRTLIFALVGGAVAMLHFCFARAPAHIAAAAFVLGLLGDLYRPAVSAAVADLVPAPDRVRAYGLLYWGVNLGFAIGAAVGGAIASHSWLLLFVGDAATTLAFALVVWLRIPESRPERDERQPRALPWAPMADLPFVAFISLSFMVAYMFMQSFVALPVDLRDRGLSAAQWGALIALNGILIFALQPFAARALDGFARHRVLAVSAALVGAGFGLTAIMDSLPGYAFSIAVWTVGEVIMAGIGPAVVADVAPPGQRGVYQGFYQGSWGAAQLAAPVVGSLVMGRFGARALWTSCLGVGLAAALGQLALGTLRRAASPSA
jgi:MFS family permease